MSDVTPQNTKQNPLKHPPNDNKIFQLWQVIFTLKTSTQNLADEHTSVDGPLGIEYGCLEYWYTRLGRQTFFSQWTPQVIENRCLEYCYTKLGRQTFFSWWTPPVPEQRWLAYHCTKLGRWTYYGYRTPQGNKAERPSHCCWHLVIRHSNSHCYQHLVVKNGNFSLLPTSSGQEWQFHSATDIHWWSMTISHYYWYPLVKHGNFSLLLTSSGQEWQFHIATDILWSRMAIERCTLRSARRSTPQMHHGIYIMWCIWSFCILQEKLGISCYF